MPSLLSLLFALLTAACVAVRFPPIGCALPAFLLELGFPLVGFSLGAAAAAEAHLPRGTVGPLWMRVRAAPRLAFAVGVSFITTVIAQTLGVSLGPVDPTFSAVAPVGVNALWFFVFTLGFTGIGMMSAPSLVLPLLHPPARLLRRLPLPAGAAILGALGAGIGLAFRDTLALPAVAQVVATAQAFCKANQGLVAGVMLALTLAPVVFPSRESASEDTEDA